MWLNYTLVPYAYQMKASISSNTNMEEEHIFELLIISN